MPVDPSPDARGASLAHDGVEAELDALIARYRREPSEELLASLVELRRHAAARHRSVPRDPWPPPFDDPFPEVAGIPEIDAVDLGAAVVGGAIAHHGSIIVRGLFDDAMVARCVASLERARAVFGAAPRSWRGADYQPTVGLDATNQVLRRQVNDLGGLWLADSPSATQQVLDDLERAGIVALVAEHFGERPCISLQKSTLRWVAPEARFATYHQDGSFLGPDTRALNVWVAFTPCGGDRPTPGLEVVPARVEEILATNPEVGRAAIDGPHVYELVSRAGRVVPTFEPGDALLFDEHLVHRTYLPEGMVEPRMALECWFFAPSRANDEYLSLLV